MLRLLLVDDHPIVLGGLEAALAGYAEVQVVARASSLAEAKVILSDSSVDVALVDVRLPDGNGFELLEWAVSLERRPWFMMLTTFTAPQYVATAIRLGARGFLVKTARTEDIVIALRRVAAGGLAFMTDADEGQLPSVPSLSERELQIVAAIVAGHPNKGIGAALGISQKTVEWYLARLFRRLGVQSRSELAATATREGWLELPATRD